MVPLAEEILNEILRYALRLHPVDIFTVSYTKNAKHMNRASRPSRHLLLVCKRWRRIGTPYLYETIELTTEDHVKSLLTTLRSSRDLCPLIRNLRIDGAYGKDLYEVARRTCNVRVLSLQLMTPSRCLTGGLARALACFNPTELYLHGIGERHGTKKVITNTKTFLKAFSGWKALRKISFLHDVLGPLILPRVLTARLSEIPQLMIGGNPGALAGFLTSEEFYSVVRKAGVGAITCYGATGCLHEYIEGHKATIPEDIVALLVYEATDTSKRDSDHRTIRVMPVMDCNEREVFLAQLLDTIDLRS
ncbi:hypothetical protein BDY19DRAFT_1091732 [Irpex rosettiformis]|uniref:Uncharacterized protein n=1 Tax=Irpex rosettiformis TaxID=378272 RepID=A0ACB8U0U4_9APHY|nr:hypothetical protein BDY19DRAFT_1091732 [Irpex rosettiformis]